MNDITLSIVPITVDDETIYAIKTEGDYALYNMEDGEYVKQNSVLRNIGKHVYVRVATHHLMVLSILDGKCEVIHAKSGFYLDLMKHGAVGVDDDDVVVYHGFGDGDIKSYPLYPTVEDSSGIEHIYTRHGDDVSIATSDGYTHRYNFDAEGGCILKKAFNRR